MSSRITGPIKVHVDGQEVGEASVDLEQCPIVNAPLSPGEVLLKGVRNITPHACRVYWPNEHLVEYSFEVSHAKPT